MEGYNALPTLLPMFALVLARIGGLCVIGFPLGAVQVPPRVRALTAVALTLVVMPVQLASGGAVPTTISGFAAAIGGELLVGLMLGCGTMILMSGMQLAGQIISTTSGMSLAEEFNPAFDQSMPVFSEVLYVMATAVFLVVGGHRLLVRGLLDTFAAVPAGSGTISDSLGDTLVTLLTQSFALGIRTAAPATIAILLATIVLGLLTRTMPQLNILMFGFSINAFVTLGALFFSLAGVLWVFHDSLEPFLDAMLDGVVVPRAK